MNHEPDNSGSLEPSPEPEKATIAEMTVAELVSLIVQVGETALSPLRVMVGTFAEQQAFDATALAQLSARVSNLERVPDNTYSAFLKELGTKPTIVAPQHGASHGEVVAKQVSGLRIATSPAIPDGVMVGGSDPDAIDAFVKKIEAWANATPEAVLEQVNKLGEAQTDRERSGSTLNPAQLTVERQMKRGDGTIAHAVVKLPNGAGMLRIAFDVDRPEKVTTISWTAMRGTAQTWEPEDPS